MLSNEEMQQSWSVGEQRECRHNRAGVKDVKAGHIGATSQQYPLLMASMGVQAVAEFAKSGKKPEPGARA